MLLCTWIVLTGFFKLITFHASPLSLVFVVNFYQHNCYLLVRSLVVVDLQNKMETPPTGASPSKFNGTLKVSVVDCTNVPKPDRFGSLNPYVNITFQGIKKKTSYKKAEANPTWNEVFKKLIYICIMLFIIILQRISSKCCMLLFWKELWIGP